MAPGVIVCLNADVGHAFIRRMGWHVNVATYIEHLLLEITLPCDPALSISLRWPRHMHDFRLVTRGAPASSGSVL